MPKAVKKTQVTRAQRDINALCQIVAALLVKNDKLGRELAKLKCQKTRPPLISTPWFKAMKEGRL